MEQRLVDTLVIPFPPALESLNLQIEDAGDDMSYYGGTMYRRQIVACSGVGQMALCLYRSIAALRQLRTLCLDHFGNYWEDPYAYSGDPGLPASCMEPLRAHPSLTCVRLFSAFACQFGVQHAQLMATLPALTDLQVSSNWSIDMIQALHSHNEPPSASAEDAAVHVAPSSQTVDESSDSGRRHCNAVLRLLPQIALVDSAEWMDAICAFPNLLEFTPQSFACTDQMACSSLAALSQLQTVELECTAQVDLYSLCGAIRRLSHLTDLLLVHEKLTDELLCHALEPLPSLRHLRLTVARCKHPEQALPIETMDFIALPGLAHSLHSLTLPCARLPPWSECVLQLERLQALEHLIVESTIFGEDPLNAGGNRAPVFSRQSGGRYRIIPIKEDYERRRNEERSKRKHDI